MPETIRQFVSGLPAEGSGPVFASLNPSTGFDWAEGPASDVAAVATAIANARGAQAEWGRRSFEERAEILRAFAALAESRAAELSRLIQLEVGKPAWEAATEAKTVVGKVALSVQAYEERCASVQRGPGWTRYKPHGVLGVLGPFNFPAHLPNGHIVPALLAGNTVVFKPSEQAPVVGQTLVAWLHEAGVPSDAVQLVQGGRDIGQAIAQSPEIDGLLFTGSAQAGLALNRAFAEDPSRILALELGGNNPLVLDRVASERGALAAILASAFITAGQRCTCARRLIVVESEANAAILDRLVTATRKLEAAAPETDPAPFLGPVISPQAAEKLLAQEEALIAAGGTSLVPLRWLDRQTGLVCPGIVDTTAIQERADDEAFGPLLQVIRVPDLSAAIAEANQTRYGLAAGILSDDAASAERFYQEARAGLINWNTQLTGASGAAPFGGIGVSGNHRPSGFFASDYCSYPVASIEAETLAEPATLLPGIDLD